MQGLGAIRYAGPSPCDFNYNPSPLPLH
jgi:hypothetical protein